MPPALLVTKLHAPPPRKDYTPRERLEARLEALLETPLALVSAPAGSGKSALLSAGLKRLEGKARLGWLTLDEDDNDPARFWNYALAAFPFIPKIDLLSPLLTPGQPVQAFLTAWINALAEHAEPLVWVLDDYHVIHQAAIHTGLRYLLEHIPPNLHVVISTRADPPLPLERWRARGQVLEIRLAELRFTAGEAGQYLQRQLGQALPPEQVRRLEARTEGWAAGLQVAALSLKDRPEAEQAQRVENFSGRHRLVLDYLTGEVFDNLPDDLRAFLLRTSILKRFSAGLCQAVAQPAGGAAGALAELERANLFLIALDEEGNWYRYHHLFAELLQMKLRETLSVEEIAGLRRRAAAWFAEQGQTGEALAYALAIHDDELAAGLIEEAVRRSDVWAHGEIRIVLSWMSALPPEAISRRPWLRLYQALALFMAGKIPAANDLLNELETLPPAADPALTAHLAASRARIAAARGEAGLAAARARAALAALPPSLPMSRCAAASTLGYALLLGGELEESRQWMRRAYEEASQHRFHLMAINVLVNQAWLHWIQGEPRLAEQCIETALKTGSVGGGYTPAAGFALVFQARLFDDAGQLAAAESSIRAGLEALAQGGLQDSSQSGRAHWALLRQRLGDAPGANQRIDEAIELAQAGGLPRALHHTAAARARLRLLQGQPAQALAWARAYQAAPPPEFLHDAEDLILARVWLANGQAEDALTLCQSVLEAGRARWTLEATVVRACALAALRRPDSALAALAQALRQAGTQRAPQVILDEAAGLRPLLNAAARLGWQDDPTLAVLFAELDPVAAPQAAPRVPLSDRELEVLRGLAGGYSNRELAEQLVVSESTVKKHVNHIFDKLEVSNRVQALARARELGLL